MDEALVVEITIAAVDRQSWRRKRHEDGTGATLDHLVALTRSNNDHLVAKARRSAQFRLDIGSDASAKRRVKGGDVGNAHWFMEAVGRCKHQVKLF